MKMHVDLFISAALGLLLTSCTDNSLSGTYVANGIDPHGKAFVEALHITRTAPGKFTGSIEAVEVDSAGNRSDSTSNVSGTIDGSNLTVTIEAGPFTSLWSNRTGTIAGSSIVLSWQQGGRLVREDFQRSSDAEYQSSLAKLGIEAGSRMTRKQGLERMMRQDEAAEILAGALGKFIERSNGWVSAKTELENRHKQAMTGIQTLYADERRFLEMGGPVGLGQANVAVSQIDVLHTQLQIAQQTTQRNIDSGRQQMAALDAAIKASPCLLPDDSMSSQATQGCRGLTELVARYRAAEHQGAEVLIEAEARQSQTKEDFEKVQQQAKDALSPSSPHS